MVNALQQPAATLAAANPISHAASKELIEVGSLTVFGNQFDLFLTNHMIMSVVAGLILLLLALRLRSQMNAAMKGDLVVKGRLLQLFETMAVFVREEIARPNLGDLTDKYIGYLWTVFFFILIANVIGLIPSGPISAIVTYFFIDADSAYTASYFGGTATGTLSLTVPLALLSFIAIVFIGLKEAGMGYLAHFNPGPWYMAPLLVPLEVMGLIIKCCVLAMRLFGTMMAGHLVIAVFLTLITMAAALGATMTGFVSIGVVLMGFAIMALELFVAALQAFIFTFLTTLFIAQGAVHHHDDHEHHDQAHEHAELHGLKAAEEKVQTA